MDGVDYKKGCLMVDYDIPDWNGILSEVIDPNDVYHQDNLGLEMKPHVTVLWGFNDSMVDIDMLKSFCGPVGDIKTTIDGINIFQTDEGYDVVKFNVHSDALHYLNSAMRTNFEYENDYDVYKPHMTLSYVKTGQGSKYIRPFKRKMVVKPTHYRYTGPSGRLEIFE